MLQPVGEERKAWLHRVGRHGRERDLGQAVLGGVATPWVTASLARYALVASPADCAHAAARRALVTVSFPALTTMDEIASMRVKNRMRIDSLILRPVQLRRDSGLAHRRRLRRRPGPTTTPPNCHLMPQRNLGLGAWLG